MERPQMERPQMERPQMERRKMKSATSFFAGGGAVSAAFCDRFIYCWLKAQTP